MSNRSGYTDECSGSELAMYRGAVASAIRGKRGQAMLVKLAAALDAMPDKRLIVGEFVTEEGDCCTLGALAVHVGVDNPVGIDSEDHYGLAKMFDVAPCLVREIEFENDESLYGSGREEARWKHMREWVQKNIKPEPADA